MFTCVLSLFIPVQLCDPRDCSPPDSLVHGILQARICEWVAMPSSRRGLPDSEIKATYLISPTLAGRFLNHQHRLGIPICLHKSPIFWISFPFRSPHSTGKSSLRYTVGSPFDDPRCGQ